MKKFFILITLIFILSLSCFKKDDAYINKANIAIENIQKSINSGNRSQFERYSSSGGFFEFYSMFAMAGKLASKSENIIVLKPVKYSGNSQKAKVETKISYNITGNIGDLNIPIPKDMLQNILKIGLPPKVTIVFEQKEDKFIATDYKFDLRYFYMGLLISTKE